MKNVQIPYELFYQLIQCHLLGEEGHEDEIKKGLGNKLDAMVMREYYTKSKEAPSEKDREEARQKYLDKRGVPDDFRW